VPPSDEDNLGSSVGQRPAADLAGGHVALVVDDEPHFLEAVGAILNAHPAFKTVEMAHSGEEALAMVQTFNPDVAVLDVVMPDMTGFQVAARLRELLPAIRVILISAVPEPEFELAAVNVGAIAFLPKKLFSAERVAALL
jgi:CheY-like chemotaxis protein